MSPLTDSQTDALTILEAVLKGWNSERDRFHGRIGRALVQAAIQTSPRFYLSITFIDNEDLPDQKHWLDVTYELAWMLFPELTNDDITSLQITETTNGGEAPLTYTAYVLDYMS